MAAKNYTLQSLRNYFGDYEFTKGADYQQQGRVKKITSAARDDNGIVIAAKVQGQKSQPYQVHIEVNADPFEIEGVCTCPVGDNCKHVIAALIKHYYLSTQKEFNKVITASSTLKNQALERWLEQIENALKTPETSSSSGKYVLYYLLTKQQGDINNQPQLTVKLLLVQCLKKGGYGKPRNLHNLLPSYHAQLTDIDKDLFDALEFKRHRSHHHHDEDAYTLQDEKDESLLRALLQTNRCYWQDLIGNALQLGEPQAATLYWELQADGSQKLRCNVVGKNLVILPLNSPWYLDEQQFLCGPLQTPMPGKIMNVLLNSPSIQPTQVTRVQQQLQQFSGIALPSLKTFPSVETKIKPASLVPHLHLFMGDILLPARSKKHWQPQRKTLPLANLSFNYDGFLIPWHDKQDPIHRVKDAKLLALKRNSSVEKNAEKKLRDYGAIFLATDNTFNSLKQEHPASILLMNDKLDPVTFSLHVIPQLQAAGWQIEFDEKYPYQIAHNALDEWYSNLKENVDNEWFDLELGIVVNGKQFNLLPLLQKLLQQHAGADKSLQDLPADHIFLMPLSDGKLLPLPLERVRHLLEIFIELHDNKSLSAEGRLRLSQLQSARLLEMEQALGAARLRWHGGEQLRQLAKKLTHFHGIQVVALPASFQAELRPYQQEGVNWLQFLREYELGGILADDMGLGKTVQALAHIAIEKDSGRMQQPSLVIAPTSVIFNWQTEAKRFTPQLKTLLLHGDERKQYFENLQHYDVIFTTYPLLRHDKELLLTQEYYLIILDEAQIIKNSKTLATQITVQLRARHRLCLSGTPLENHLGELWSLFHFLMPGLLGHEKLFKQLFRLPIEKQNNQLRRQSLMKRVAPFLLRRTKDQVIKELPSKIEMVKSIELNSQERDLYETIRITMHDKITREINQQGLARSQILVLDALLKLRQICCDPRLLKMEAARKIKANSTKLMFLMELLPKLIAEGRQILLFSQFAAMLTLIEEELKKAKIPYVILTGQTKNRVAPVQQFQNGKVPLFLISLKAGGTGLNLTSADTVIHYDPWWNPAVETQATDRAHRIGQNKTVFVYKLVTKGSVEEKIIALQQRKQALISGLFSDQTPTAIQMTAADLETLFAPLDSE